jgi:aspartate carbamoyltransferase regulatory subunit
MNDKRQRFERVAGNRVQAIIEKIDSLAKCSNKNNYSYSEQDVKKMFSSIKAKLKYAEQKYYVELGVENGNKFAF